MKQEVSQGPNWVRFLLFLLLFALVLLAGIQIDHVSGHGVFLGRFDKIWGAIFVTYLVFSIAFLVGVFAQLFYSERMTRIFRPFLTFRNQLHWLRWPLALLCVLWPAYLLCYSTYSKDFSSIAIRLYFFVIAVTFGGIALTRKSEKILTWIGLLQGIVLFGSVFLMASKLVTVTNFPLSLGWSEGNRFWDYSVLFGRDLYIYPVDQPLDALIDLGRQSLWGLPFLLPSVSIAQIRLWSVIVGTIPYALFGWVIFRIPGGNRRLWFFMGLWVLIFLYQGPIYAPLVLAAILVAFARRRSLWLGLLLIAIAGYYASMSRYTWMFAPAIWAMMISIIDHPPEKLRGHIKNWSYLFIFGLAGFIGAVGGTGWQRLSPFWGWLSSSVLRLPEISNPAIAVAEAGSTTSSPGLVAFFSDQPLLWSRLLPSPAYPEGIILGLLLAVGPLIVFLLYLVASKRWKLNRWQKIGIILPLLLFLIVGLIISVKIGGGDNLHNLDMFLISLVFVTALAWRKSGESTIIGIGAEPIWLRISVILAVAIPAFYPVIRAAPLNLPPTENIELTLEFIQRESQLAVSQGKEVLFMDQRQLLTFGFVEDVPLVADYEKKRVMNEAMSGDRAYFENFYRDLANHRFGLIIIEPQVVLYAEDDDAWAEENDVWIAWVTEPLLCYYEPKHEFKKTSVWLFVPRTEPLDCAYP